MKSVRTHMGKGDEIVLVMDDNELHLVPPSQAVKKAQAVVRQFVSPGRRLAKELIQERRQEARRESRAKHKGKG